MRTFLRTPEGKALLFHVSTGEPIERWPVDAKEILTAEDTEYTAEPPAGWEPIAPVAPVPSGVPMLPKEHPLGMPLVATHARDAAPAELLGAPRRVSSKKGQG